MTVQYRTSNTIKHLYL